MREYHYVYIDDFHPIPEPDLMRWAQWFGTAKRHVADTQTVFGRVSTVFLGLDHNHMGVGEPILFETMIFGGQHDQYQTRYCTVEEARAGHQLAVALATAASVREGDEEWITKLRSMNWSRD